MTSPPIPAVIAILGPMLVIQAPQQPLFRSTADAVVVHALVQAGRRTVSGLTCDDFELRDSGVVQRLDACSEDSMPLEITILADASHSVAGGVMQRIRQTAEHILALAAPIDRVRLIRFASAVRPIEMLDELAVQADDDHGHTSLLDAVATSLMLPLDPGRRRVVFVLSDGVDTYSLVPRELVGGIVDRSDAILHIFAIKEAPSHWMSPMLRSDEPTYFWSLRDLTNRSGGTFHLVAPATDLSQPVAEALEELRTRYLLRYVPANVPASGWHPIDVKVKRPGRFTVTARKGYQRSGGDLPPG